MLVLFETPAGYALFKVLNESILKKPEDIYKSFASADKANAVVKLKDFKKFKDTTSALVAATAMVEGKLDKGLSKFLKKSIVAKEIKDKLAVSEAKLGNLIKDELAIKCVNDSAVNELVRGLRSQMSSLITGLPDSELNAMALGLSHSLSRYKLKFSPDKVDTMIVQAIALLDDIDKELNIYSMRVREWYGWHFPEVSKIITDNHAFARFVKIMGHRTNVDVDLSDVLEEEVEKEVKEVAQVSMGTEISEEDMLNVKSLGDQVISLGEYRAQLFDYLKNRMNAIAPNLTALVGDLVGARLIAHAGSLLNLAKQPASTVQILGAEKALFRALKTKKDTPKYGLIYHASLVGQCAPKHKGKISRVLAAKAALATRVDALSDTAQLDVGVSGRTKVESRMRDLEGGHITQISGKAKSKSKQASKYENKSEVKAYNPAADSTLKKEKTNQLAMEDTAVTPKSGKKKKRSSEESEEPATPKSEKKKKRSSEDSESATPVVKKKNSEEAEGKSKKKRKADDIEEEDGAKKKKKKKSSD